MMAYEYKVVQSTDMEDFVKKVNDALKEEWETQGGMVVLFETPRVTRYFQSLVRWYEKEEQNGE